MGWCRVPDCHNLSLTSSLCAKHELDQTVKQAHERKEEPVKVKVAEGKQVKDKDGKLHTSGVIDMKDADAKAALMNGWVTEAKAAPKAEAAEAPEPATRTAPKPRPRRVKTTKPKA